MPVELVQNGASEELKCEGPASTFKVSETRTAGFPYPNILAYTVTVKGKDACRNIRPCRAEA
jgi:hypothetical protein